MALRQLRGVVGHHARGERGASEGLLMIFLIFRIISRRALRASPEGSIFISMPIRLVYHAVQRMKREMM
jgi:hypothetical protein